MRAVAWAVALAAAGLAAACEPVSDKADPLAQSVIDETNLNDLMLTVGDPAESVSYFAAALAREPDRVDFRRGYAVSLARDKKYLEAARIFEEMISLGQAEPRDRLEYAFVLARLDRWDAVQTQVAALPPGFDGERRHIIAAMLADHNQDWATADAAYEQARLRSTNPAPVLNNWGVSLMSRGDFPGAVKRFEEALSYDSRLFNAKNNLAIARGLQGDFALPLVPMTDEEKAIILNNLGMIALRKGDARLARGLFAAAVEAHPRHYEAAAGRLAALEGVVEN